MSKNKMSYIVSGLLILIGLVYFFMADALVSSTSKEVINVSYFPKLLSVILIILCITSIIGTVRKEDEKLNFPMVRLILITLGVTVLYFVAWINFNYFYVFTLLYMFVLMTIFRPQKRFVFVHIVTSVVMIIVIYGLFEKLLYTRF